MGERSGEFVTADEAAVVAETSLDTIVMEDSQSSTRLANSTDTD